MLAKRIKLLSAAKGMTLAELAEKVEMSRSGLFLALKKQTLTLKTAEEIAKVLETDLPILLGWYNVAKKDSGLEEKFKEIKSLIKESYGDGSQYLTDIIDTIEKKYNRLLFYSRSLENLMKVQEEENTNDLLLKMALEEQKAIDKGDKS
ncbi:MAG: helix-turn-helix domain-containing protein [Bacteroidota bacterium]